MSRHVAHTRHINSQLHNSDRSDWLVCSPETVAYHSVGPGMSAAPGMPAPPPPPPPPPPMPGSSESQCQHQNNRLAVFRSASPSEGITDHISASAFSAQWFLRCTSSSCSSAAATSPSSTVPDQRAVFLCSHASPSSSRGPPSPRVGGVTHCHF